MLHFKLDHEFTCKCGREHHTFIKDVLIEPGAKDGVVDLLKMLNLKGRSLIVTDSIVRNIIGEYVEEGLKGSGYVVHCVLVEHPDEKEVHKVLRMLIEQGVEFAVAIGGTSVIDTLKSAAYAARRVSRRNIPYVAFTTTAANDGLASATASIYENRGGQVIKVSRFNDPPLAVIADLDVIKATREKKETRWMIPAGFGEMVAKITSLKDWGLGRDENGEYYCDYIASMVSASLDDELSSVKGILRGSDEGIRDHVHSLINTGVAMTLAGSSRPCSGAEHLFSHALDSINQSFNRSLGRHGEQVAVGARIMANYHKKLNQNWWMEKRYQPDSIKRFLIQMGCPSTIEELKVDKSVAVEALIKAKKIRPERFTILHKWPLDKENAQNLLSNLDD